MAELGGLTGAHAEEQFIIASTGGGTGEGVRDAFITAPKLEQRGGTTVLQALQLDSVGTSKMLAQPGNPPFSVITQPDDAAFLLADRGLAEGYDLSKVTNYKDIFPSATASPRAGMEAWYASYMFMIWALTYNTKYVTTPPASYEDMWSDKFSGRIGIPAYGWFGMMWLHVINRVHGGTEDDVSKGIDALADLVKRNKAIILENSDQTAKAFERGEIVMAPFFNGRTFSLQSKNVPVKIAYVPGTTTIGNGFMLTKGARFREQANLFVNNTLDPEYQLIMTKRLGYPPTNRKSVLPSDMAHYAATDRDLDHAIRLDWAKISAGRDTNLGLWNRKVLGA
jgi:putative spermidine/putrescine transport system substrate-binding protein